MYNNHTVCDSKTIDMPFVVKILTEMKTLPTYIFLHFQAKVSMKNTDIICKLEDLFNQMLDLEESTPLLEKCAHNLQDTLTLLRT